MPRSALARDHLRSRIRRSKPTETAAPPRITTDVRTAASTALRGGATLLQVVR
jgi:hypothetical protein